MTEIRMPKLSDSMEEGLVLQWLVDDGGTVAKGDELVEIETDKATMTHEAEADGTLQIVVPEGTTVPVGALIAHIGNESHDHPKSQGLRDNQPARATQPTTLAQPTTQADPVTPSPSRNGGGAATQGATSATSATPLARRIATQHGVALEELNGTGPRGRITKADVLQAAGIAAPTKLAAPTRATAAAPPTPPPGNAHELSRLQLLIARRMAEAKATIPHFQVETEVTMDAATAFCAELKTLTRNNNDDRTTPSINDMIVKACALALRRHPRANGSYKDATFVLHERVNVGIAVAAEDALIVPTVTDADTKPLGEIARDTRRLAARVRAKDITPPELSGATFTVSNLGMYGMTAITPVINPPQAAILGVGATRTTLARDDHGEIVDRSLLTLTLSCDHRILYGADAAAFLADVKTALEAPLQLLL